MGCRNRDFPGEETASSSLSEALLFATMCIIGLPVDVHVKDGSVYSGIFHTACFENGYGIVLKKARMSKKGKGNSNVANGGLIDTLVILSGDLVQLVAKGVLLPADGIDGNVAGNNTEAVVDMVISKEHATNDMEITKSTVDIKRYDQIRNSVQNENGFAQGLMPPSARKGHEGRNLPLEVEPGKRDGINLPEKSLEASSDPSPQHVKTDYQCCEMPTSADTLSSAASSVVSTSKGSPVGVASESCRSSVATSTKTGPVQISESNRSAKESKLNPGAKIFSPSSTKPMSATPLAVQTVAGMGYMPSNSPMVPVPAAHSEVGSSPFTSHPSIPVKIIPYSNLAAGNGVTVSQFTQPIVGHVGNRTQPLRHAGQHPMQAGPGYMHPNPQTVMVGRLGQLVYMHPLSQELVPGMTAISSPYARPLSSPHQVQFPKQQGAQGGQAMQVCLAPPLMVNGQQPYSMPRHIPILQPPLPANRHIQVPGPNGLFGSKIL
ncbi:hypothetical protein UlMin_003579 [Ulmus minor]